MANSLRGEVDLLTPEKTYTMRMSINAIVNIEEHFDMGINQVADLLADPNGMRIGNLRTIVMYALLEGEPDLTPEDAGDIVQAAGFDKTADAIQKAMLAAFPSAGKKTTNPPRTRRAGTGKAS